MPTRRGRKGGTRKRDAHVGAFLQRVCSDTTPCVAFGDQAHRIFSFFEGFDLRSGLVRECKALGVSGSGNGAVRELRFEKDGYTAYALAKIALKQSSDNLVYEYAAGLFLNAYCDIVPCFNQTYGIYQLTSFKWKQEFLDATLRPTHFPHAFRPLLHPFQLRQQCTHSEYNVLVTHFLAGSVPLANFLNGPPDDVGPNIFAILFQVYYGLDVLSHKFTHYDLYSRNVLLYKLPGPMLFRYESPLGVIEFKCAYLAKIIDYGRVFFHSKTLGSRRFRTLAKKAKCTRNVGFGAIRAAKNVSQHLRLFKNVMEKLKKRTFTMPEIDHYLKKVIFADTYTTPERVHCENDICTVHHVMRDMYYRSDDITRHAKWFGDAYATLVVDGSGPMRMTRHDSSPRSPTGRAATSATTPPTIQTEAAETGLTADRETEAVAPQSTRSNPAVARSLF